MTSPNAAVVLTQIATPDVAVAIAALAKMPIKVKGSAIGAYLLFDATEIAPEAVLRHFSGNIKDTLFIHLSYDDAFVKAESWRNGLLIEELPAALVLDGTPHEIEDLVLGQKSLNDLTDVLDARKLSRFKASRILVKVAREAKKVVKDGK